MVRHWTNDLLTASLTPYFPSAIDISASKRLLKLLPRSWWCRPSTCCSETSISSRCGYIVSSLLLVPADQYRDPIAAGKYDALRVSELSVNIKTTSTHADYRLHSTQVLRPSMACCRPRIYRTILQSCCRSHRSFVEINTVTIYIQWKRNEYWKTQMGVAKHIRNFFFFVKFYAEYNKSASQFQLS